MRSISVHFPAYLLGLSGPRGRFRCRAVAFFRGPHQPFAKAFPVAPGGRHRGVGKSPEGRFWRAFLVLLRGCKSGRFAAEGGRFDSPRGSARRSHRVLKTSIRWISKPLQKDPPRPLQVASKFGLKGYLSRLQKWAFRPIGRPN